MSLFGIPLVGRRHELDRLHARFAGAAAGQGSLVFLVGEPGIGKTRIAHDFADYATGQRATVLWGSCLEDDVARPYGPWVQALGARALSLDAETLRAELGAGAAPVAELVPAVRNALPGLLPTAPLSTEDALVRLYDAVTQWLGRAAVTRPVVLVLDDLHWADRDSLRLLRHVARSVGRTRILIVGQHRPPEQVAGSAALLVDTLALLLREPGYDLIELPGLDVVELQDFLSAVAARPIPPALVQAIHLETGGNPFYAREVIRHLDDSGAMARVADGWRGDVSIAELGIPTGVRHVVRHRLATLSSDTVQMLQTAAAFSGGVTFAMLQTLVRLPDERLLDCLDEALRAGMIRAIGASYDFSHAIVRHALSDAQNPDRRARLHRRIAVALEQTTDGILDAAEIAAQYHASAGLPDGERGVPYCLTAAGQARAKHAPERAVTFLRMASDLAIAVPARLRADILCRLAVAEAESLLLYDAQRTTEIAITALEGAGLDEGEKSTTLASFLADVAAALKEGGAPFGVWSSLVSRGLAMVEDKRDILWARLALLLDHFEPVARGEIPASRWIGWDAEAVIAARASGDERLYAMTLAPYAERSRAETDAILALARIWTTPSAIMRALDVGSRDLLFRHAAFHEAAEGFMELDAAGRRFGSIVAQAEAQVQLACCHVALGNFAAAVETQQRAEALVERLGAGHRLHGVATVMNGNLLAYLTDSDHEARAALAERFLAEPGVARSPHGLLVASLRAMSLSRAGQDDAARQLLETLTPFLSATPPRTYVHNISVGAASIAVWDIAAADLGPTYERMARDLAAADVAGTFLSANDLTIARMRALAGDVQGAEAGFARAHAEFRATRQLPLLAITDLDEALALVRLGVAPRDQARVASLLASAEAAMVRLGAGGWVARVEAVRSRLGAQHAPSRIDDVLTSRQREILGLVAAGRTNKEIASALSIGVPTVERHLANIYGRLDVRGRVEAVAYALRHELVSLSVE